jgi:hypothetical protein
VYQTCSVFAVFYSKESVNEKVRTAKETTTVATKEYRREPDTLVAFKLPVPQNSRRRKVDEITEHTLLLTLIYKMSLMSF